MIIQYSDTIAAGATYPISQNGIVYELTLSTGRIGIKNSGSKFNGQFNILPVGIQPEVPPFEKLQLKNIEDYPVVFSILISDKPFKNNQIIIGSSTQPNVTNPTYPLSGESLILIPDLTGQSFVDLDGNKWLAIFRQTIIVSNPDGAADYVLQPTINPVTTAPFPGYSCLHATCTNIPSAGDFSMSAGGGPMNVTVMEIYSAIPFAG